MTLTVADGLTLRESLSRISFDVAGALLHSVWRRARRTAVITVARGTEIRSKRLPGLHARLARHPDSNVRQYLATRPATPRCCAYQEILAVDPDRTVRSALARCRGYVCATALTELAVDDDSGVRAPVAERGDIPVVVWGVLAHDPSSSVRLRLARNPAAPHEIVRILCADPDGLVRNAAKEHRNVSPDALVEVALRSGS